MANSSNWCKQNVRNAILSEVLKKINQNNPNFVQDASIKKHVLYLGYVSTGQDVSCACVSVQDQVIY